ncbi:hypothetical protein EXM22_10345 [Oceanispirochaeta crateris]|uniref:Uroporphyrinogen decarboxylase (URO-D) domain-containing protein n=1 Tax=Oceanispirochaeta crateris TaxID=2518645 RepID=A0A5C1QLL1_9SPIO|nr:uroporphyrinogen decarboxylase family protein [Oceanispirochaeta crateris]QEN08367.1 hypothetical protein EXM22_10345 [Oceanispirochaeta crateris]
MLKDFKPDYTRLVQAARNEQTEGIPLYEHHINLKVIASILSRDLGQMYNSQDSGKLEEMFGLIAQFHIDHGYDCYSFEGCLTELVQGGKGLTGQAGSIINNMNDFREYPWDQIVDDYFKHFDIYFKAIRATLPEGMKIVGGVGNGIFESIQDFVPFTNLAYLEIDDPELFATLWMKVGETLYTIWDRFLSSYSDILAIGRFGDDLGFKSAPLLNPQTIKEHILPQYKNIVSLVQSRGIPFLLHSCGCIFDVMDDIIQITGIDAKHSNEDAIAPFSRWVDEYGDKIGNFGGFDMDVICRESPENIRKYVHDIVVPLLGKKGLAFGSGNQIANYVPPENFQAMVEEVRLIRGF